MDQNQSPRFHDSDSFFDNLVTFLGSIAVQDMGQPSHIVGSAGDWIAFKITTGKFDALLELEPGHGQAGEWFSSGSVENKGPQPGIVLAKMDGMGTRTATEIQQPSPVTKIYLVGNLGRDLHGQVEHSHDETFPLYLRSIGSPLDRTAGSDRLVKLGPAIDQMVVMQDDVPHIIRR